MNEQNLEELGEAVDRLSNLIAALSIPMPMHLHVAAMKESLPSLRDALRGVYVSESGENPWAEQ